MKTQQAAFAFARVEMCVGDDAAQDWNAEKIRRDHDLAIKGIGERFVGA